LTQALFAFAAKKKIPDDEQFVDKSFDEIEAAVNEAYLNPETKKKHAEKEKDRKFLSLNVRERS
jgi:hypothetical protein